MSTRDTTKNNTDAEVEDRYAFAVALDQPGPAAFDAYEGFNEYGVRENVVDGELESLDVMFYAMEPGIRKNLEITPEFLQYVAEESSDVPLMLDHSDSQLANVGTVTERVFNDGRLGVVANIPNTGSSVRSDVIADFRHSPPAIGDGSVGFDPRSIELSQPDSDEADARFERATLREFSLTPFPAGYDNGGLTPAFSDSIDEFVASQSQVQSHSFDDSDGAEDDECDTDESQLVIGENTLTSETESQLR